MQPTLMIRSLTAAAIFAVAPAQDLIPKASPIQGTVALTGATIHPVSGPAVEGAALLFKDGKIRAITTESLRLRSELIHAIDCTGLHIYPGLIAAWTTMGLAEIGQVPQTVDTTEVGAMTPEAIAAVAVNPDNTVLPVTRSNGILTMGLRPRGGLLPGRASVMRLDGWTNEDMAVKQLAGLVVSWPARRSTFGGFFGGTFRRDAKPITEQRDSLDTVFDTAAAWHAAREVDASLPTDVRLHALGPALRGETAVFLEANEREAIESGVLWAKSRGFQTVLVGGRDAADCAEMLVREEIPVILTGVHVLPRRRDTPVATPYERPARMAAAGLKFCIGSGAEFWNERNLPYEVAAAIAHGLDPKRALRTLTLDAAEILGVGDTLGSLEVGKEATLIVTDGDPLALRTRILHAFTNGARTDLRNKQTELAAKYRKKYRDLGIQRPADSGGR